MGYKAPRKRYNLEFEEASGLGGLEVSLYGLSTGKFLELSRLVGVADGNAEAAEKLIGLLTESLVSWNLEDDDDRPVPVTKEGVLAQDLGLVLQVIKAWMNAVGGVSEDLGKGSTSGSSFPDVNLPTELLSSSLVS